jgi:hypothetical protein
MERQAIENFEGVVILGEPFYRIKLHATIALLRQAPDGRLIADREALKGFENLAHISERTQDDAQIEISALYPQP